MKQILRRLFTILLVTSLLVSCVTKKKKNETTKFGKFYHNTTAYYNGYWNAEQIMKESMVVLRLANVDDYNKILEVEDFVSVTNPKMVKADMDKILEKVTTVAQLHEPSEWIDDCYVMMAKAQYLKQEYETTEETLLYFQEDFNPSNPYGRNYKSKKLTGKAAKKQKEAEKKEKAEVKKVEKEKAAEIKEEKAKTREEERKDRAKQREADKKAKEKARKEAAKSKKKSGSRSTRKKSPATEAQDTVAKTKEVVTNKPVSSTTTKSTNNQATTTKTEEVEPEYVAPEKKKPQVDETAYSEGLLWLAKTYIKRENYYASELLLKKLEDGAVSDDIKSELPATFANLYIKQERYAEAIPKLVEAIDNESSRQLKARYSYIAGQLAQKANDNSAAMQYFADAKKYSKDIKMEFMSELAIAKNGLLTGQKSKEDVLNSLKRMLNEDKNVSVKDQIYFTMAEIELSQKNEAEAISHFKNSIGNNISDQKLKAEAYYNIATLFYEDEMYLKASFYYDTTSTLLANSDSRYTQVQKLRENLKDIAANIAIINQQDSLLYFATLSNEELQKQVPPYLDRNRVVASTQAPPQNKLLSKQLNVSGQVNFGNSTFFAYNKNINAKGQEDFKKTWGRRALEDDWRRSSKASGNIQASTTPTREPVVSEADAKEKVVNSEEYKEFIKSLPNNPIRKQEANDKIVNAMFTLGKLFRDKIENFAKSAETLEGMHTRFGPTPYELDSYYYIYLDYVDLNNGGLASEYKNKIIKKYPDSKYTSILTDPEYFAKTQQKANKPEAFYKAIYAMYEKGQYSQALDAMNSSTNIPDEDNPYLAKLSLLRAMCVGNVEGKDAYIKALSDVIVSYPNTAEQTKAKEIMRFLGGDKNAFSNASSEDVEKAFVKDETGTHYVIVVTYQMSETDQINAKVAVSEYNKANFKTERLQLGDAMLNIKDNSQIILIRKFSDGAQAMEYYKKVNKDRDAYIGKSGINYDIYPVSQGNYRSILKEQALVGYRAFFETNYGGDK